MGCGSESRGGGGQKRFQSTDGFHILRDTTGEAENGGTVRDEYERLSRCQQRRRAGGGSTEQLKETASTRRGRPGPRLHEYMAELQNG